MRNTDYTSFPFAPTSPRAFIRRHAVFLVLLRLNHANDADNMIIICFSCSLVHIMSSDDKRSSTLSSLCWYNMYICLLAVLPGVHETAYLPWNSVYFIILW